MSSLLVRNGLLVTMDPQRRVLEGDLYAVDGVIREVGTAPPSADVVIEAAGKLVLPGFVQVHVHLCQTLFRGLADDMDVVDWLRTRIWPLEQAHDEESLYDSARLAIAEMIRGGTTCALTMETVRHSESALQAVVDSGFRATCGKALMDNLETGTEMVGETTQEALTEALDLLDRFHGAANGRVRYALSPRGTRNASSELWQRVRNIAQDRGVLIHSHAAENREQTERLAQLPGGSDVVYLASLGVLGPNVVLAHCVWVTPEEREILARSNTRVAHCPSANLKLASGYAPIPQMLEQGIAVGLGADGAPCNNNLDMFREMRLAALIHKPQHGPRSMSAPTVLEMATLGGARALGLDDQIGSLEVDKRADLVVLSREGVHTVPRRHADPISALVYAHQAADVETVVIDGDVVLRDGCLTTMDESEISGAAEASLERVLSRANLGALP
jgi:cytosine/adenosine deaminase-related metal-dependent hydrolase